MTPYYVNGSKSMAKFLTTTGTASAIEEIIRKAKSQLVIVTPYLMLNKHVEQRLKDANKRKVQITLIYGKKELAQSQVQSLEQLQHLDMFFCENLHAKCYHNETTMVMSSMNLYEYSEKNNREMGVQFDFNEDKDLFQDACEEIESIKNASKGIKEKMFTPGIIAPHLGEKDFHLPLLHKMLAFEYPDVEFHLATSAIQAQFCEDVELFIDYRTKFGFKTKHQLESFKSELDKDNKYAERCFWNLKYMHLYLPLKHNVEVTEDEQVHIANYFIDFIRMAVRKLSLKN